MSISDKDSILNSIKELLGSSSEYDGFDVDVMFNINKSFGILSQVGVGPSEGFRINDSLAVWTDFLPESVELDMAKEYVYLSSKLVFDPPTNASVLKHMEDEKRELESRLSMADSF